MSTLWLLGRDFTGTAEVGAKAGKQIGIALAKGGAAKLYAHQDPNEDACLAMEGDAGALLAVADGHGGEEGARVAIEHLRDAARTWCDERGRQSDETWRERLTGTFVAIHEAVLALRQRDDAGKLKRAARTTLSLALLRRPEGRVFACSVGDSHVYRVDDDECHDLAWPRGASTHFLGSAKLTRTNIDEALFLNACPAEGHVALVVATDGLSEPGIGAADPKALVREAIAEARERPNAERASAAAQRIVDETCEAQHQNGAGDNVAVAVVWSTPTGTR